jgi:hypothetical protein
MKEGAQKNLGPKRFQNGLLTKKKYFFAGHVSTHGAPGV